MIPRVGMTEQSVSPTLGLKQRVFALEQWIGLHVRDDEARTVLLNVLHQLEQGIKDHSR